MVIATPSIPEGSLVIETLPFQGDFLESTDRVVLLDGPWRSGKTHILILDALNECEQFPGNLIWMGRHESTKLRDSTIRDFHRLIPPTKENWREQPGEYRHPNGSIIMFRHLEDKTGLVNMDLGGVFIEQAEECQPDAFDFLLGRLSRIHSSRKMRLTCNPNGHDWLWQIFYRKSPDYREGYRVIRCPPADQNPHVPASYVEELRASLSPEMFEQYVIGSRDIMLGYRFFDAMALRQQLACDPCEINGKPGTGYFVEGFPKPEWRPQEGGPVRLYERRDERDIYCIGSDIATGEGSSWCASVMLNCRFNRVAAVIDADMRPDEQAVQACLLSRSYGNALIAPERNGVGVAMIHALSALTGNIFTHDAHPGLGWLTTAETRAKLHAELQRQIAGRSIELKDRQLIEQCQAITMSKRGRPDPEPGFRNDLVMALGIAAQVRKLRGFVNATQVIGDAASYTQRLQPEQITGVYRPRTKVSGR